MILDAFVAFLDAPALAIGALRASTAELLGALLGVAMVGFNMRVNPIGWPLAIASSALYLLVFWRSRLYGDASLQIVFIVVAFWGWWQWLRGRQDDGAPLVVRHLGTHGRRAALLAMALLWPATGWFLARATDTDVPWWDAFPTAGSLIGQWLLGRKYIENWPAWVAVNVVGVALFGYKGLWLTSGLYALFALLALAGWREWARLAGKVSA